MYKNSALPFSDILFSLNFSLFQNLWQTRLFILMQNVDQCYSMSMYCDSLLSLMYNENCMNRIILRMIDQVYLL